MILWRRVSTAYGGPRGACPPINDDFWVSTACDGVEITNGAARKLSIISHVSPRVHRHEHVGVTLRQAQTEQSVSRRVWKLRHGRADIRDISLVV